MYQEEKEQERRGSQAAKDIDTSSVIGAAMGLTGGRVQAPAAGVEPGVIGAAGGGTGMHDVGAQEKFNNPQHPGPSGTADKP